MTNEPISRLRTLKWFAVRLKALTLTKQFYDNKYQCYNRVYNDLIDRSDAAVADSYRAVDEYLQTVIDVITPHIATHKDACFRNSVDKLVLRLNKIICRTCAGGQFHICSGQETDFFSCMQRTQMCQRNT